MELASFVIALLAAIGTLFTYLKHDKKIKDQQTLLNEYELKRFHSEEIDKQKAQIKGNIIKGEKGKRTLVIFNAGKATAYNIRLENLNELNGIIFYSEFEPYEMLNSQDKTEIIFHLTMGHTPTLKIKYIWDDDYKKDNEFVQLLSL